MLSNSSSIEKRRIQHRRQNSTPAIFEAAQVRPLPAAIQRQIGHRRGISLEGRSMLPGQKNHIMMPNTNHTAQQPYDGPSSVSIHTNHRQQLQQTTTQVAQQHSEPQPGTQILDTPQTPSVSSPQPMRDILLQADHDRKRQKVFEKMKELQDLMSDFSNINGDEKLMLNLNMSLLTPEATPQKSTFQENHVDFAPMPSSLSDIKEICLDPPLFDERFSGLTSPITENGYESSYYSEAVSPSHGTSPQMSPQHHAAHEFKQATAFADNVARQLFPNGQKLLQPCHEYDEEEMWSSPSPRQASPQPLSIAGIHIDATIEDTGISAEDVQQYISTQDLATGRWTCLFPECGKDFGRRENIRAHVQTHLGDRQFKCNHCHKRFVRQHDLKRHSKIHTGDKSNKCPCGAGFARQDALTRHRQRGMCVGGFPNIEKKIIKRGRPKKTRPDMDSRLDKSSKTRRALASASSSISAGSPLSDPMSPVEGFNLDTSQYNSFQSLDSHSNQASDPFSFDSLSAASPLSHTDSFSSNGHIDPETTMMSRSTTQYTANSLAHTPPMSPSDSTSPSSIPSPLLKTVEPCMSNNSTHLTPPGSPPALDSSTTSYDSLFATSYEFSNAFCGSSMDANSMDAFITGIDSIDNDMDFRDLNTSFDGLM